MEVTESEKGEGLTLSPVMNSAYDCAMVPSAPPAARMAFPPILVPSLINLLVVSASPPTPRQSYMTSTPHPPVCSLTHSIRSPSSSDDLVATRPARFESFLTSARRSLLRPIPRILTAPMPRAIATAATPNVPVTPLMRTVLPAPKSPFLSAPYEVPMYPSRAPVGKSMEAGRRAIFESGERRNWERPPMGYWSSRSCP